MYAQDQLGGTATVNQAASIEKSAPPIPVITGGIALNSSFDKNESALLPVVAPIILVPLGKHALIESEFEAESEVVHTQGGWEPVTLAGCGKTRFEADAVP